MALSIYMKMLGFSEFCDRGQIVELAIFGSVLRDDFCP
jgi:predicted nucleotidyltransferase